MLAAASRNQPIAITEASSARKSFYYTAAFHMCINQNFVDTPKL